MAHESRNAINTYSNMFNLDIHEIKGSEKSINTAVINGMVFNKLDQHNNEYIKNLFKGIASGEVTHGNCKRLDATCKRRIAELGIRVERAKTTVNEVTLYKDKVNINGNNYNFFDCVKDLDLKQIMTIVDEVYKNSQLTQTMDIYYKFRKWWNNGGANEWAIYKVLGDLERV